MQQEIFLFMAYFYNIYAKQEEIPDASQREKIGVQKENLAPRFNILFILGLTIDHRMTKWHKRIDHQLEVLQAKRNTDDSTAEYST